MSAFRKSSYSGNGGCVEVAISKSEVRVRDSKDPDGPGLRFNHREWAAFLSGVRRGEFGEVAR